MTILRSTPASLRTAGLALLLGALPGPTIEAATTAPASATSPTLRPSHEELAARQKLGPVIHGKAIENTEAANPQPSRSNLLERSTILRCGAQWTIVPRNAVLYVPETFQDRIASKPSGTLVPWREFYAQNRGWLHLQPVRLSDARGETSLDESVRAAQPAIGRVVVAVLQGGPISMPIQSNANHSNSDLK